MYSTCFAFFNIPDLSLDSREEFGRLSDHATSAVVTIQQNDDPFGVLAFPAESREHSIAEDVMVGDDTWPTMTSLTVERRQVGLGSYPTPSSFEKLKLDVYVHWTSWQY